MRECISIHVGQAGVQIGKLTYERERRDWPQSDGHWDSADGIKYGI